MVRLVQRVGVVLLLLVFLGGMVFAGGGQQPAPAPAASQAQNLERTPMDPNLFRPGQLTVATGDPVFPPYMMDDSPESGIGFENGLVYALAAELGFSRDQVVWVRTGFNEAIAPGPKPYDFNIQQFSVTEERAQIVSFSQVYFQPQKAVIALPGSPVESATSFANLRTARWGAALGTTDLIYLENIIGVQNVQVFDDQAGVFQAMQAGLIDATVAALPTALFVTAVQVPESRITAVLPADENDRGHGLLFSKDSPLIPWIDDAITELIGRGVVSDLVNQYLVGDASIREINQ